MIEIGSHERQDRTACDLNTVDMSPFDDLLVSSDDLTGQLVVFGWSRLSGPAQHANVVNSFQNDQVARASLCDYVVVKARKCVGAKTIHQHSVPTDALVQNCNITSRWSGL